MRFFKENGSVLRQRVNILITTPLKEIIAVNEYAKTTV